VKTLTIKIPDNKYKQFLEMIKSIGLTSKNIIAKDTEPTKEQILDGLKQAVKEVNEIKAGKRKPTLLNDFLNDL
jgi:hypothetical protein